MIYDTCRLDVSKFFLKKTPCSFLTYLTNIGSVLHFLHKYWIFILKNNHLHLNFGYEVLSKKTSHIPVKLMIKQTIMFYKIANINTIKLHQFLRCFNLQRDLNYLVIFFQSKVLNTTKQHFEIQHKIFLFASRSFFSLV